MHAEHTHQLVLHVSLTSYYIIHLTGNAPPPPVLFVRTDHWDRKQLESPRLKPTSLMTLTKASVQTLPVVMKWVAEHIKQSWARLCQSRSFSVAVRAFLHLLSHCRCHLLLFQGITISTFKFQKERKTFSNIESLFKLVLLPRTGTTDQDEIIT